MAVPNEVAKLETKYRPPRVEDWPKLFELIAEDHSLTVACKMMGLHRHTVEYRIADDAKLSREFMLARASRADALADKAIDIANDILTGGLLCDPKDAKIAASIYQWAAAQMAPKSWGQATTRTELTGKDGKDLQLGNNVVIFQLPTNERD